MANSNNGNTVSSFLFKNLPDLSYRSHKLSPLCPVTNELASSFEIRPTFLDRVRLPAAKTSANLPNVGRYWVSGTMGTVSGSAEGGVTGIPNLVELDDAFNPLDPGQLLRESAAAASRMLLDPTPDRRASTSEMVDELLQQIYAPRVSRAASEEDDATEEADHELSFVGGVHFSPKCADSLKRKDVWELEVMRDQLQLALNRVTSVLIQQLTRRDRLRLQRERHCDVITAILQAASPKRSQDTKMRFSVDPPVSSGSSPVRSQEAQDSSGFQQWHDAMRMVARLPGGVPPEFRRKLWLTLAEQHLLRTGVDWTEVERNCFNERINPEDEDLGAQIVRDLHRTGCSLFCGDDALPNQAVLKRVLLAYARWNKAVGYCQGLNVLAALLLEVMNRSETESLKVMIYLIEGVLPEGYFANNLRGLSVDMTVFRDMLRQRLPALSRHFEMLQQPDGSGGSSLTYCIEPPLTNVFTMQWFLTLFATCLPKAAVLRVWDLVFLEGNDVLLRTALAIWQTLAERILTVRTCDDFYSIMAVLAREMLEFGLMEPNHLVQTIVSMAPFPFPGLGELRDKHRYNITPWSGGGGRVRLFYSDDDPEADADEDEDEEKTKALNAIATVFGGLMTSSTLFRQTGRRITDITFRKYSASSSSSCDKEKLQLDIAALRKQYAKLRERQKQAHVMFWTAAATNASAPYEVTSGSATNHTVTAVNANPLASLLAGKKPLLARRSSTSAASGASACPRLRLPPARVVPPHNVPTTTQNIMHTYFSAPTTPSEKDTDGPFAVMSGQQCIIRLEKDSSNARPRAVNQSSRRNSGSAASELKPNANNSMSASKAATGQSPGMSANRSRLVQELLEQNSAMLQKLKDRSDVVQSGAQQTPSEDVSSDDVNKLMSPYHNPFPRQLIHAPKEVTVKLGMYDNTSQKY